MRTIVTLCGSTRFYEAFQKANYELTMLGKIVLSVGFYPHHEHSETAGCTPQQKIELDRLHLDKIAMSDEVYVLNVDGYIGESTCRKIQFALGLGIFVDFLDPHQGARWLGENKDVFAKEAKEHGVCVFGRWVCVGDLMLMPDDVTWCRVEKIQSFPDDELFCDLDNGFARIKKKQVIRVKRS